MNDDVDRCPGTPAGIQVDAVGCRILFQERQTTLVLEGVNFETGKADLTQGARARAESVQNFLLQNGVSADRLEARGYGPDNPIDSNDTRAGRARNRRVELTRLN